MNIGAAMLKLYHKGTYYMPTFRQPNLTLGGHTTKGFTLLSAVALTTMALTGVAFAQKAVSAPTLTEEGVALSPSRDARQSTESTCAATSSPLGQSPTRMSTFRRCSVAGTMLARTACRSSASQADALLATMWCCWAARPILVLGIARQPLSPVSPRLPSPCFL